MKSCAIIITAYKSKDYILESINSIKSNLIPNGWTKEIFIGVDACQETLDYLLENNYPCYYADKNVGTYVLTNSLLKTAYENNFDAFVRFDSDDIATEKFLFNGLTALTNRNFVRASYRKFDNDGNFIGKNKVQGSYGCVFFDRKIVESVGGYRQYRVSCDKDFVLRVAHSGFSIAKIYPPAVYLYRQHSLSLTSMPSLGKRSADRKIIEEEMARMIVNKQLKVEDPTITELKFILP